MAAMWQTTDVVITKSGKLWKYNIQKLQKADRYKERELCKHRLFVKNDHIRQTISNLGEEFPGHVMDA